MYDLCHLGVRVVASAPVEVRSRTGVAAVIRGACCRESSLVTVTIRTFPLLKWVTLGRLGHCQSGGLRGSHRLCANEKCCSVTWVDLMKSSVPLVRRWHVSAASMVLALGLSACGDDGSGGDTTTADGGVDGGSTSTGNSTSTASTTSGGNSTGVNPNQSDDDTTSGNTTGNNSTGNNSSGNNSNGTDDESQGSSDDDTSSGGQNSSNGDCGGEGQNCCPGGGRGTCDDGLTCDNPMGEGLANSNCYAPDSEGDGGDVGQPDGGDVEGDGGGGDGDGGGQTSSPDTSEEPECGGEDQIAAPVAAAVVPVLGFATTGWNVTIRLVKAYRTAIATIPSRRPTLVKSRRAAVKVKIAAKLSRLRLAMTV